jgi:C-terminal processing protease CtpA/Prc
MKLIKPFLFACSLSLLLNSCQTIDGILHPEDKKNEYVDSWILTNMSSYYYWNDQLPDKTDKTLTPDKYFKSILYTFDPVTAPDGDRFSWIESDYTKLISSLNGVVPNEIGFDLTLYYKDATKTDVIGQINYVKKGTPAASSGIKRGMFFDRVNGTVMTASNYSGLLHITTADVTIGFVEPIYDSNNHVTGYSNTFDKTLQTVSEYSENPVYMDTVFVKNGHKIGYFVYHFFAPDGGNHSYSYDLAMNAVFGRFKTAGITDLILDLRYNSGGHTTSSRLLASEIVPDISNTKLFTYYRYNLDYNAAYIKQNGVESLKTYFTTNVLKNDTVIGTVNNVGNQLSGKVYILTGPYTASASEQVINGLYPYMDVVLVGDTTYGKNVASTTFYDKGNTKKNKWGMQPIIAKYFNSLGKSDFTAGFAPDFVVKDGGLNMKEFGDPNEPLLNTALNDILGTQVLPIVQKRAETIQTDKLLSLPGKRIRGAQLDNSPFFE